MKLHNYEEAGTMRTNPDPSAPTSQPAVTTWDANKAAGMIALGALAWLLVIRRAFSGARGL